MNRSLDDLEPGGLRVLVGTAAIAAPGLHILSDVIEWLQRGFSPLQLWMTYAAFVAVPPMFLGLCAVQRRMRWTGLVGALLYGVAFVYFAHSALYPLEQHIADYATAWRRLGPIYTIHGALMIVGGLMFGVATLRARMMPPSTALMFIGGLSLNLLLFVFRAPESLQPIGSIVRNAGLIGMGVTILRSRNAHNRGAEVEDRSRPLATAASATGVSRVPLVAGELHAVHPAEGGSRRWWTVVFPQSGPRPAAEPTPQNIRFPVPST